MFDAALRRLIDPPLNRAGLFFHRQGISANTITVAGFFVGMGALPALALGRPDIALICILLNRLMDGLDGAIARQAGPTDIGGYLDIVLDFLFYGAVPFGFALMMPEFALSAAFLIFSFIGTGSSFLAYAIVAEKRKITTDIRGLKSFYYLGGLTEGGETIAFFILLCLLPQHFNILAWVFGSLCWITTVTRIWAATVAFGAES
ncbi:CDP-alcohol phosphatidyltransferase family protein [Aestuariispira insulae]|uniref:Phosphatidylglycerophosphate synthase n=1 Tax=Aestuariispira insulae TaxID=1461337 RepID=A0A3D9HW38_9PROT|nr:CDP-alcohol phosphatidyltransferase family protein [Aestuariispira insulae]RED53601.1 phosphatidylglycerophosphate synthase [Aestuariispira insulae]